MPVMIRLSFVLFAFFLATLELRAEMPKWVRLVIAWVDSADVEGCDRNYVALAEPGFLASFDVNLAGSRVHVGLPAETSSSGKQGLLHTVPSVLLSTGVSYRGWGLSYSRDVSHYGDNEFKVSFHSRRYGLQYRLHNAHSLHGSLMPDSEFAAEQPSTYIDGKMGHLRTALFNAFWVFDHKRFSLPAATIYTTVQLRSCGSWLAMFNYWHGSYRSYPDQEFPASLRRISLSHLNLGAGYAYNYVFANQSCLLHGSLAPMLTFWHRNRLYRTDDTNVSFGHGVSADLAAQLRFVYNHGRYVSGMQSMFNCSLMPSRDELSVNVVDWLGYWFVGIRF